MAQRILVAIDNSPFSDVLFTQALDLAKATASELLLVHGLSNDDSGPLPLSPQIDSIYWAPGTELDLEAWRQSWGRYESASRDRLRGYAAIANTAGVTAEFRQLVGRAAPVICKAAQEWGANLIVIGHRGRQGLAELVMGSVSNEVMHRAPCSVLVVKAADSEPALATDRDPK